ncbi:MAG TPA: DUF2703 domain-containing protein [Phycisphaerales bacterium]|nr:DUF2703 domain-containing protein [Phycisphaerales bacterium]
MIPVRVVYFEGCPNLKSSVELIRETAKEIGVEVAIDEVRVSTDEQAKAERMLGSPTIQVRGIDIDPAARSRTDYAMSCRVFDGNHGLPPRPMLIAALTDTPYAPDCGCKSDTGSKGCCS